MSSTAEQPTIVPVGGRWLGAWAWDRVRDDLADQGHRVVGLTLPGLDPDDPDRATRTLDEQAAAILDQICDDDLEVVDLPTGHWPMWSRPRDLARVIDAAAQRVS